MTSKSTTSIGHFSIIAVNSNGGEEVFPDYFMAIEHSAREPHAYILCVLHDNDKESTRDIFELNIIMNYFKEGYYKHYINKIYI